MFQDWSASLSSIAVDRAPERQVRAWLAEAARHQAAVEAFVARCAGRLGDASVVRGATRSTQREADRAIARAGTLAAMPRVGAALEAGAISGTHVDVLGAAAERTSAETVAASGLLELAKAKPADAMRKQITDFVRHHASDDDLAERHRRQLADRRASLTTGTMGVLHAEFDDATYAQIKARIDAETDRMFRDDGGRASAAKARTPQQRRAVAVAALILGTRTPTVGPPAVRNQAMLVVHADGTGHIPGIGPLPKAEVERWLCISDLYGIVLATDGQPLWLGAAARLATDAHWRALIVRDGGCIGCGADPSRCEGHHIAWVRDGGPTDIDNLVLVCTHHHHLIHDKGWKPVLGDDGTWSLAPP